jgi:hypothetical protein
MEEDDFYGDSSTCLSLTMEERESNRLIKELHLNG